MSNLLISAGKRIKLVRSLILFLGKLFLAEQIQMVLLWKLDNGDNTLRINYKLKSNSVVFDVGGYIGEWAREIFEKYNSQIYVFEPVVDYYEKLKKIFYGKKKIIVLNYGLAEKNKLVDLHLADDSTSEFGKSNNIEKVRLRSVKEILKSYKIKKIDLMKINIEGGEYELLEYLIKSGIIKEIKNIQIQFHLSVRNARERANKIQMLLSKTHTLIYQYPFVWESWSLKIYDQE